MEQFGKAYFKKYHERNILGLQKGERPFLYSFWMRKLKKLIPDNAHVLEAGCGVGYFLTWLERIYDVTGLDLSSDALGDAKKRTSAKLHCANAESLPFENSSFAAIVAFDLIEHLSSPEEFIKGSRRVLSENGIIVISTPNPESFGSRIKPRTPELEGLPYEQRKKQWYGWRDDTHISIKKRDEWRKLLKDSGFAILCEGTDTLWDVPYFHNVPEKLQKAIFMPPHWILTYLFGFFPWPYGENYVCIARRNYQ